MSSAGLLSSLANSPAYGADVSGYKALVCVFFKGGMDHADTVLPYDQASYNELATIRESLFNAYNADSGASSRNRSNLLQLAADNGGNFGGRQFALPPELSPLHQLFESGDMAIVGNVGPLVEPTTRTQMDDNLVPLPPRLFSHNDQQSTWTALRPEGSRFGWGGRFADMALASAPNDNPVFSAISASGNEVFLSGENARQFRVSSGGGAPIDVLDKRSLRGSGRDSDVLVEVLEQHFASEGINPANLFEQDVANFNRRASENNELYRTAVETALPLTTTFPDSSLGRQLRSVAETISIRGALNTSRQVYFVSTGGFDTHNNQANSLPGLHGNFAASIAAFHAAMTELGEQNNVTLFTASDFGRTTIDNGDGTDHGWGAHHFVVGGAVNGRNIYGELPGFDLGAEHFTKSRGRLIPAVSVEQYAATLGSWFGLSGSELSTVLPNLGNFNTSNLGFMGGGTT
jgi:uncharacterized protein (DUF1501 family)